MAPEITTVTVLGAGTMGRGIAHVAAVAGFQSHLYDTQEAALRKAEAAIATAAKQGAQHHVLEQSAAATMFHRDDRAVGVSGRHHEGVVASALHAERHSAERARAEWAAARAHALEGEPHDRWKQEPRTRAVPSIEGQRRWRHAPLDVEGSPANDQRGRHGQARPTRQDHHGGIDGGVEAAGCVAPVFHPEDLRVGEEQPADRAARQRAPELRRHQQCDRPAARAV